MKHRSTREFEIIFRSSPQLRDMVRAISNQPLPSVPFAQSPKPDPAQREREERRAIEQVVEQLRQATHQLTVRFEATIEEMRQASIELAVAVASRVVFDKLQAGDFPIEEMVRQALARLPAPTPFTVYLHPDDLALMQKRLADAPLLPSREAQVRIEADGSLKRGGCRAEAGEVHVLADLADQLAGLRQHLLWSASHAQSGSSPSAT